jgi:hypothetical protein
MRIDPDTCRDPDRLAAEVRRLQSVIAASTPTLADAEREAIGGAADLLIGSRHGAALRGLLDRTK